ncbi:MAG: membrane protein insertion efficiency factor YidD [Gammaproteobacteria bacterium]|nr:membrane protein insertion efficiency factor YidD [Gammaproteobacteria bacterium]MCY4217654.1 membrane protein insertion efficiency factor YidD [Gammaproteobacteria bacterium]MCY4274870.1 membrane protein insertion efficiency factor YidD [Gammaproteobacteria bacterium]
MSKPKSSKTILTFPSRSLRFLIRIYQLGFSPYLGCNCRYHPTCSRYALEAIDQHGALKGSVLAIKRIARCHPWNVGGYDPVPKASLESEQS